MKFLQCVLLVIFILLPVSVYPQTFINKSASLTWQPNTETNIGGYKIYRGLDRCEANPPMLFLDTVGRVTAYVDNKIPLSAPSTVPSSTVFKASADFSGVQGQRNWYYRDSLSRELIFSTAANRWQGVDAFSRIWSTGIHPGNQTDTIRRWTAPITGTVQITGGATLRAGGGGVIVIIRTGTAILWQRVLLPSGSSTYDLLVPVKAGQSIDFIINMGEGGDSFDSTDFDPTIAYTGLGSTVVFTKFVCYAVTAFNTNTVPLESEFSNKVGKVVNLLPGSATGSRFK